ncbi:MAG: ABC transporter ATP-binding protein/permease [Chloroflexota bacterium]|nr:ABC transporter ATP-binding protein/permease [Chloroflexota bacterium]
MRSKTGNRSVIARLYSLVLPYRRTVLAGMACLALAVAAELYPPIVWKTVVDDGVLGQRGWVYIGWQLALLVLVFAVGQLLSAVRGVLLEKAGQQLTLDLRLRLYEKLQRQSVGYFAQRRTGDLLARLTADVEIIQDVLVRGTDSVVANALRVLGVAAIFIWLQPILGAITLLPMVLVGVLLLRYNKRVRPVYRAARERLGDMSAKLADNLGGIWVIQGFAQEERERRELEQLGKDLYEEQVQAVRLRNRVFPFIRWVANFGNVLMLGGGVFFILRGQFTVGGLLAYRGYGRYFYGPVDDLVNINDLVQRAAAAGRRIFEVLDAPENVADLPDARPLPSPLHGSVRFENVSFGYDPERPVLRDVTLDIQPGERVAILGPSGVGKSTLLALVARLYDPDSGRVLVDGQDLRATTLRSLRSQMAQVQQETFLFNTSALDNLRYGRPEATLDEMEAAARAANAHEFLSALPSGYHTVVGERGVRLSGGQKQRIAVARALLADPRLLLLDEPTSAMEPESEAMIIEALERLMWGRTTLVVSHRFSLARNADRVLVVSGGHIVEQGAPDELLALPDGHFAAMWRADSAFATSLV